MARLDSKNTLLELFFDGSHIKAIKYRRSTLEPFQLIKFCSVDPDGLEYYTNIFDMTQTTQS